MLETSPTSTSGQVCCLVTSAKIYSAHLRVKIPIFLTYLLIHLIRFRPWDEDEVILKQFVGKFLGCMGKYVKSVLLP